MGNFSSNERYLIINADDFGMCHSANIAIQKMLQDRVITSASLMPVCPWFEEAVKLSRELDNVDLGVHLTFTSEWQDYKWGSLSGRKSLLTKKGYFPADCYSVEKNAQEDDILIESWAQINKVVETGLSLSHIDNHMGSIYGLNTGRSFLPQIFEICKELKLPFRFPKHFSESRRQDIPEDQLEFFHQLRGLALDKGIEILDYLIEYPFFLEAGEDYQSFTEMIINLLRNLKPGVSELYIHPSVESDEIKAINPHWEKRVMEYRVFYEDRVQKVIEQEGIQLISWRDLKEKMEA